MSGACTVCGLGCAREDCPVNVAANNPIPAPVTNNATLAPGVLNPGQLAACDYLRTLTAASMRSTRDLLVADNLSVTDRAALELLEALFKFADTLAGELPQ